MKLFKYIIFTFFFFTSVNVISQSIIINEVMSSNFHNIQDEDGDYPDWIEIYNTSDNYVNLLGFSISDDIEFPKKWILPNIELASGNFLLVFASGKDKITDNLHTNFKINGSGEKLWLRDGFGNIIDSLDSVTIPADISLGRNPSDQSEWLYFNTPTPGFENDEFGASALCSQPIFSLDAGFYDTQISLELTTNDPDSKIYYTTNGSTPDKNSEIFSSPISIVKTTVVNAICVIDNLLPSKIKTMTYLIDENHSLPVISISTNPSNLWDTGNGIYVDGLNGIPGPCSPEPKNYNRDWEKPINVEFFELDKSRAFNMKAGVKIYGGCSRTYPQKSLAIYARRSYGFKSIDYPIFSELPFDSYEAIVLRNSGDDYYSSFMRDGLMHSIVNELDLETQAYRPSVVFLNGEYWGIHNIREKINEDYLAQHHDIDPNNIDFLEKNKIVISGDANNYNNMLEFLTNNDMSLSENFDYIETQMDVDNFIAYTLSQIYFDNTDWPGNNIKYWRSKDNGKWRWILYDTDFGFGFKSAQNYKNNTLEYATAENGQENANKPWATFLIRKLLKNDSFKQKFISTYADYTNSIFKSENVISKIEDISENIKPEIPNHIEKWGEYLSPSQLYSFWLNNIANLKNFASNRISYLNEHFTNKFGLSGTSNIRIEPNYVNFGKIRINSMEIENFPWEGIYFNNIPIKLKAVSRPGYKFVHWTLDGSIISLDEEVEIVLIENETLKPIFEEDSSSSNSIVINEINYNSKSDFYAGDWVELTNVSEEEQNLSNWILKDENENIFVFPVNTTIQPKDFIVLVEDSIAFKNLFPEVKNYKGNLGFKLNNEGEFIELREQNNFFVDSIRYSSSDPWPNLSDGTAATIELSDPSSDNALSENWYLSSSIGGTPARTNSEKVTTNLDFKQDDNMETDYYLGQNYPNPFNPTTNIAYSIPKSGHINLSIYDVLGNEVISLIDEYKTQGQYSISFNAEDLTSGIYFYSLKHGQYMNTKKMLLIK
jgi:hypothetical protein